MKVCGVELTNNEAIICLFTYEKNVFTVPDCRQRVFTLSKTADTEAMRGFYFSFNKLMEDYKIDEVVIIERAHKGKLAGTAISFKLEAAIQLLDIPVSLMNHTTMKAQLKRNKMHVEFESLGLKKFQKMAMNVAFAYQNQCLYGDIEETVQD